MKKIKKKCGMGEKIKDDGIRRQVPSVFGVNLGVLGIDDTDLCNISRRCAYELLVGCVWIRMRINWSGISLGANIF